MKLTIVTRNPGKLVVNVSTEIEMYVLLEYYKGLGIYLYHFVEE